MQSHYRPANDFAISGARLSRATITRQPGCRVGREPQTQTICSPDAAAALRLCEALQRRATQQPRDRCIALLDGAKGNVTVLAAACSIELTTRRRQCRLLSPFTADTTPRHHFGAMSTDVERSGDFI